MRKHLVLFALLFSISLSGQESYILDFEEFNIEIDSFDNGVSGSGGFEHFGIRLPNEYNEEFMSWTGWALSNKMDTLTPGFTNQYSAITGSGVDGSSTYAVSYHYIPNTLITEDPLITSGYTDLAGFYITNSTYAYYSMKDGDFVAKKFGGETGEDPDFLKLTIIGSQGGEFIDSIEYYLADFRNADNSLDYIVDQWEYIDLGKLRESDLLTFKLTSSDVGMFGINTPTYFCIDNLELDLYTSTEAVIRPSLSIFPNPASDYLNIQVEEEVIVELLSIDGKIIWKGGIGKRAQIDISSYEPGKYIVKTLGKYGASASKIFIKN